MFDAVHQGVLLLPAASVNHTHLVSLPLLLLLLCRAVRYGARPHYGKMWSRVYTNDACPIRDLLPNFGLQLHLQHQYDPARLFETALLSAMIAGGEPNSHAAGCSNEMMCYCDSDADCGVSVTQVAFKCKTAPAPLPPYKVCLPP